MGAGGRGVRGEEEEEVAFTPTTTHRHSKAFAKGSYDIRARHQHRHMHTLKEEMAQRWCVNAKSRKAASRVANFSP